MLANKGLLEIDGGLCETNNNLLLSMMTLFNSKVCINFFRKGNNPNWTSTKSLDDYLYVQYIYCKNLSSLDLCKDVKVHIHLSFQPQMMTSFWS